MSDTFSDVGGINDPSIKDGQPSKKPSAAAMRATEKIFWLMQNCRPVRQEDRSVATIIDAEFAPLVEALMELSGAVEGLFVGYPHLTECKKKAIKALAALGGK